MISRPLYLAFAGVLLFVTVGFAQQVSRDEYQSHLPAMAPRVGQTAASVRFALYGDPSDGRYLDALPLDGIDDARGRLLLKLAARFSPVLRRNNFSRPQDFRASLGHRPVLQVDTWSMGRRIATDSVLLYEPLARVEIPTTEFPPCPYELVDSAVVERIQLPEASECARSDALLVTLLEELDPERGEPRQVRAEAPVERVLFFDFPGEDERSWRRAYQGEAEAHVYAHFFINADPAAPDSARYHFVIQYWFFYPFNDGPNNHEGDWEHIAVAVTTARRADAGEPGNGRLTEADVRLILAGGEVTDSLVISRVEYYFHESVIVLDYLAARTARPHSVWQELKHLHLWQQSDFLAATVAHRLFDQGGRLATHPLVYIGGNAKGPDELLAIRPRFGRSYNRNAHGSYPFAGTWQGVGPLGSTETVAGELVPRPPDSAAMAAAGNRLAFADAHVLSFEERQIQLLPDWERAVGLVRTSARARRELSWLLLPIRWGYPATASPGAGAVKHVDMGHLAPVGPMFQGTWNRLAEGTGRHQYTPRVLRVMGAPVTPWDRIQNGWGVLNMPRMLLGFLPGWSMVLTQLSPWLSVPLEAVGLNTGRTFAPERRVDRFTSSGIGAQRQFGGQGFARLLPAPGPSEQELDTVPVAGSSRGLDGASLDRTGAGGMRAWWDIHYGPRFSVQSAYSRSASTVSYDRNNSLGTVQGVLKVQELLGGFRYRLSDLGGTSQVFAGGGWGWTWYKVGQVTCSGMRPCSEAADYSQEGGYGVSVLPSRKWWPNTWYLNVGLEISAPRSAWLFDRVGYGLQLDYTGSLHRLSVRKPRDISLGPVARREVSVGVVTSW